MQHLNGILVLRLELIECSFARFLHYTSSNKIKPILNYACQIIKHINYPRILMMFG